MGIQERWICVPAFDTEPELVVRGQVVWAAHRVQTSLAQPSVAASNSAPLTVVSSPNSKNPK